MRRPGAEAIDSDPRATRTHSALNEAFLALLREMDLTEITISMLCARAGVHRTTFYGHHGNVFELARQTVGTELDQLLSSAPSVEFDAVIRQAMIRIQERRETYRALFDSRVDVGFRADLYQRLLTYAQAAIQSAPAVQNALPQPSFMAGAYAGILEHWAFSDSEDLDASVVRFGAPAEPSSTTKR